MVTPLAPDLSGLGRWGPPALSAFLTALAENVSARLAYFVPVESGLPSARSRPDTSAAATDTTSLDAAASQWLAGGRGETVRVHLGDEQPVDIAAVRSGSGEVRGALLVARKSDARDLPSALAEVDLAATLLSSLIDHPTAGGARQALVDWASVQEGGRTAFAISIDRLNVANEVLGFQAGDALLRTLDARMVAWAGPTGRLARVGGARYVVIRPDVRTEADALIVADRLSELIARPVDIDGLLLSRSASIGVAVDPAGATKPDLLLGAAVRSGAAARASGGNRIQLDDGATTSRLLERLRLELELYSALADGQLRMHYQPEFDLVDGRVVAVEALLRWQHPRLGLLGADSFVPEAEQTRTFAAVQYWVIDETCRQLAAWRATDAADNLMLRVNVPGTLVVHGQITAMLTSAFERHRLPPARVCVELTERRMPDELPVLTAELAKWRAMGVSVALDDFGTGEGTLTHLIALPVDILKIDQSFVGRMTTDPRAAAVVAGIAALADSLDLEVVAEGIESADAAAALVKLGCRRGQGNALAEPMVPAKIAALLRSQHDRAD